MSANTGANNCHCSNVQVYECDVQALQIKILSKYNIFIQERKDNNDLPFSETADKEAKRPQAAAFAPEVIASASASSITPVETPWMQLTSFITQIFSIERNKWEENWN